jgi:hypothetical protein
MGLTGALGSRVAKKLALVLIVAILGHVFESDARTAQLRLYDSYGFVTVTAS